MTYNDRMREHAQKEYGLELPFPRFYKLKIKDRDRLFLLTRSFTHITPAWWAVIAGIKKNEVKTILHQRYSRKPKN